jgi:hypothetical protein
MSEDGYNLDDIIKSSFEEAIEYFNKNGIKVEGLRLRIVKSIWSLYYRFIYLFLILLFIDTIAILYYATNIQIEYFLVESIIAFFTIVSLLFYTYHVFPGFYNFLTKEIFILKKQLEKTVNEILDELNNNIKDSSVIGIKLSKNSIISYPFYVDIKNIRNKVIKTVTDTIIAHEIGHAVIRSISRERELKASAFEYLVYFYKNEFYNYPEVYKIIEENIKIYKTYIEENKRLNIYELGRCYGNIIIHKNKQSINIKDIIEEIKNLSEKDVIDTIKNYEIY